MEQYIAGFGEVMLRLAPAGKTRFAQALPGTLEATYGGGEANVCASLAILGEKSRYLTALPRNPISQAFAVQLRGLGVDVDHILYRENGRMGSLLCGTRSRPARIKRDLRPRQLGNLRVRSGGLRLCFDAGKLQTPPCDRHHSGPQRKSVPGNPCHRPGSLRAGNQNLLRSELP